jgi:P-type Cu2+ transporter
MSTASLAFPASNLTRQVGVHLLDDPQEWSSFSRLDAKNIGCWESNLMIEGMHCAACALTIEEVLLGVPGVQKAEVSAGSHRARVVWSADAVLPSGWMQAIEAAGYRAVPANDAFSRERRLAESRKTLWMKFVHNAAPWCVTP